MPVETKQARIARRCDRTGSGQAAQLPGGAHTIAFVHQRRWPDGAQFGRAGRAEQAHASGIDVQQHVVGHDQDGLWRKFDKASIALFALAQCHLGLGALTDLGVQIAHGNLGLGSPLDHLSFELGVQRTQR